MEWKSWKYKNLTILLLSFLLSLALGTYKPYHEFIFQLGYVGAFFAGILFVFTFTAPLSAVTFLILAERFPLVLLIVVSGFGAILSDFTFFRTYKDGLAQEIEPIYEQFGKKNFKTVLNTQHFRWLFPVIGALILLTPFPKEPGIHLLGISKLKSKQFLILSAGVNIIGILFIFLLSFIFKP